MENFFETLKQINLNPIIIILIIAGGFFQKRYLAFLKISEAWRTLIIGSIFSLIYALIVYYTGGFEQGMWLQLFFSYVFATSFYELIINPVVKFIRSKLGASEPEPITIDKNENKN